MQKKNYIENKCPSVNRKLCKDKWSLFLFINYSVLTELKSNY